MGIEGIRVAAVGAERQDAVLAVERAGGGHRQRLDVDIGVGDVGEGAGRRAGRVVLVGQHVARRGERTILFDPVRVRIGDRCFVGAHGHQYFSNFGRLKPQLGREKKRAIVQVIANATLVDSEIAARSTRPVTAWTGRDLDLGYPESCCQRRCRNLCGADNDRHSRIYFSLFFNSIFEDNEGAIDLAENDVIAIDVEVIKRGIGWQQECLAYRVDDEFLPRGPCYGRRLGELELVHCGASRINGLGNLDNSCRWCPRVGRVG